MAKHPPPDPDDAHVDQVQVSLYHFFFFVSLLTRLNNITFTEVGARPARGRRANSSSSGSYHGMLHTIVSATPYTSHTSIYAYDLCDGVRCFLQD